MNRARNFFLALPHFECGVAKNSLNKGDLSNPSWRANHTKASLTPLRVNVVSLQPGVKTENARRNGKLAMRNNGASYPLMGVAKACDRHTPRSASRVEVSRCSIAPRLTREASGQTADAATDSVYAAGITETIVQR